MDSDPQRSRPLEVEDESRVATIDTGEKEDYSILDGFPEVWDLDKLAQEQQDDPELGPVCRWLAAGNDRSAWEDISDLGTGVKSWWSRWDTLRLCLEDRRPAD